MRALCLADCIPPAPQVSALPEVAATQEEESTQLTTKTVAIVLGHEALRSEHRFQPRQWGEG
jgi:hypothetical protein